MVRYDVFNHLGSYKNIIQFQIILEGKTGNEIPECSILESLEKFLSNDFALSGVEDNTYDPLNRGSIADLAICQNSRELSFWEVMDSVGLVAYASLASSRTLLQRLLACLYFLQIQRIYFVGTNEKIDFYELWQQQDH